MHMPDIMSISGYLVNQFPQQIEKGQKIIIENVEFTILTLSHLVIHKLKAKVLSQTDMEKNTQHLDN